MTLREKKCVPCEGGTMSLTITQVGELMKELNAWTLSGDARAISKSFSFKNFASALAFANKIGEIAESENHHPDLTVKWGNVGVELSTHAIGGLSENDFILASKIDAL